MAGAKKQTAAEVKKSLLDQLMALGRDTPYYRDMVDAYMDLRREREAFRKDIAARGFFVDEPDKWGTVWRKVNPSVAARQNAAYKMAQMLKAMGLNDPVADEDEEL